MKKIAIITINDNDNYGNRLQNYAIQEFLKSQQCECITLKNIAPLNEKNKKILLRLGKYLWKSALHGVQNKYRKRAKKFKEFNRNIKFSKHYITAYSKLANEYDYFFVR